MKKQRSVLLLLAIGGLSMAQFAGCDSNASDSVKDAVNKAEQAAGKAAGEAGEAAKKMGDVAKSAAEGAGDALGKLGEKALGFVKPLRSDFGNLEELVSDPAKLKQAADDLIKKLEQDMSGFMLPKPVTDALGAAREKLTALRDYITEEADPAVLKEKVKAVMDTVKTALGMG